MTECKHCGKNINYLPWVCKRCGQTLCDGHRLPEDHNCSKINQKSFFEPLTKKSTPDYKNYKRIKTKKYKEAYEMYAPERKKYSFHQHFLRENFSFSNFLRRYIYPRVPASIKPHLMQFLLIFLIGIVLDYVYYKTFSLTYLFIGGINEWFRVLIPAFNYGLEEGYDLVYLIINGIYYGYFYYNFILAIYHTIVNLDKKDTWIMLGWFALAIWALIHFFPQII